MKAVYTLSRSVIPSGTPSKVDLLLTFRAEATQGPRSDRSTSALVIDRSGPWPDPP